MMFSSKKYFSSISISMMLSAGLTANEQFENTQGPPSSWECSNNCCSPSQNNQGPCSSCECSNNCCQTIPDPCLCWNDWCCPQKIDSCWGTFSIAGEYLLWQPVVTGLAWALTHTETALTVGPFGPGDVPDNISIRNVKFHYGPGYRIKARYTFPCTGWDIGVCYTKFTKKGHDSVLGTNLILTADPTNPAGLFIDTLWDSLGVTDTLQGSADMRVKYRLVRAELGKSIQFHHCFVFRPSFGVQFIKLKCHENINYTGITLVDAVVVASIANVQLMNDLKGWGLFAGLDATWRLPWYFEIYGEATYNLSRVRFTIKNNEQTFITATPEIDLFSTTHFNNILHHVQIKGGLDWDYPFAICNHPYGLKLYAGYEMNLWIQALQFTRIISLGTGFSDAVTTNIGNIGFRGLTAGVEFSF